LRFSIRMGWGRSAWRNLRRYARVWESVFLRSRLSRWSNMRTRTGTAVSVSSSSWRWWPRSTRLSDLFSGYCFYHIVSLWMVKHIVFILFRDLLRRWNAYRLRRRSSPWRLRCRPRRPRRKCIWRSWVRWTSTSR
jgi:hypothetical protein